tara:strand:- start:14 stop:943 length:930 start_codon:yes stop_codon:yes gene_type:complete
MADILNICVMLGGPSSERDVSLKSGAAVVEALRHLGHQVIELDPVDGKFQLSSNVDVVFLALHGSFGEDGTVQKELDELGVPYTGCSAEVSRLAFNKIFTKRICEKHGLVTAKDQVIKDADAAIPIGLSLPLVLKPIMQGSSIGLEFVETASDWSNALFNAMKFGGPVLVEEKIVGREITVGILGGESLPLVEIIPKEGDYDYTNKYTAGATNYICPAQFKESVTRRIKSVAEQSLIALGGGNCARVDFIVREDGEPVLLEVNTLPGMTATSLLPRAAQEAGMNFIELCQRLVDLALDPVKQLTQTKPI